MISELALEFDPIQVDTIPKQEAKDWLIHAQSVADLPEMRDTVMGKATSDIGILLIHGYSGTNIELLYLANDLAHDGYRVAIPLLPGHGTNWQDLLTVDHNDWLNKARKAFHFLQTEYPGRQIFLAGHSLGGSIALKLASEFEVRGVAALAAPIRYRWYFRLGIKFLRHTPIKIPYEEFHFIDEQFLEHPGVKYIQKNYSVISGSILGQIFDLLAETYEVLVDLTCPLALIYARQDRTVPAYHVKAIVSNVGSNMIEINWLDNSGHIMVIDADRELVNQKVRKFIKEVIAI